MSKNEDLKIRLIYLLTYLLIYCMYLYFLKESRVLRTVPLLAACLPQEKCNVIVGRRFNDAK